MKRPQIRFYSEIPDNGLLPGALGLDAEKACAMRLMF